MPEMIRAKGGSLQARLRKIGLWTAAAVCALSLASGAVAQEATRWPFGSAHLAALAGLDRHEIAALTLILGVLFFAVVTAVLLVRTHARASASEAAARDRIAALKSDVDRLTGLLLSEPQLLVSWPAGRDPAEVHGKHGESQSGRRAGFRRLARGGRSAQHDPVYREIVRPWRGIQPVADDL